MTSNNSETTHAPVKGENQIPTNENSDKDVTEIDSLTELQHELLEVKNEAKENFESMLRAKAELENYKKRATREMHDFRKYALKSIMKELLTIVDNLERAIESAANTEKNTKGIVDGINLTLNEMIKILEEHDITPINSIGETFDPKVHQAMSQKETSAHPANTVIEEFLKGYLIHGQLLRPAMVVVSKKSDQI